MGVGRKKMERVRAGTSWTRPEEGHTVEWEVRDALFGEKGTCVPEESSLRSERSSGEEGESCLAFFAASLSRVNAYMYRYLPSLATP
jgi:hypothetical protein